MVFIGNQTSCWAPRPTDPFDYALVQHFTAFEWFPDKKSQAGWDEADLDAATRKSIRETARAGSMRLSVHARWQANPLVGQSQSLLDADIELARDLGAVLLNIHLFHENGLPAFVQAILPLAQRLGEAGLQLAIENTPHHSPEMFNELFARLNDLDAINPGCVGMCLDIGHANLSAATLNNYLGFVDRLDRSVPIVHLHLHENWGDSDSHLTLFTGPSARDDSGVRELLKRLKLRNFSGSIILEQWPQPPSLLNAARDRLLELWGPEANGSGTNSGPTSNRPNPQRRPGSSSTDFVAELVSADGRLHSWREKLEWVGEALAGEDSSLNLQQLVDIAIYLRFLATGEVTCAEDGRHFRPVHHARLAAQIHQRLAQLKTPQNEFVLRRIYPWLPSSAPEFQRAEPLTRIRDIAHRNDIDSELKREIKTGLQNKLHRCAGPEDLITSTELLNRITTPGTAYSSEFVEQFKIFHEELKEFFNARSLDDRLSGLAACANKELGESVQQFLRQKSGTTPEEQMNALRSLTQLRSTLADQLAANDQPVDHELVSTDIALEDFAFVLFSQIINEFEHDEPQSVYGRGAEALRLALTNLALSGVEAQETGAILSELNAWGTLRPNATRIDMLRLRATVLRSRRVAEQFGNRILGLYSQEVDRLGHALGVAEHAIQVFAEGVIRGDVIFQASKLCDRMLRQIREQLGASPWDVLVTGKAVGRAIVLNSLLDWKPQPNSARSVVILKSASGDEEIPKEIGAIALAHELPHLSHLTIRARQAGIAFATCEAPADFEKLQACNGQIISFTALPDNVSWDITSENNESVETAPRSKSRAAEIQLMTEPPWLPLEQARPENGGGKVDGVRRLALLADETGAGFRVPGGLLIPFGVMEAAWEKSVELQNEYRDWMDRLNKVPPDELTRSLTRMQEIVHRFPVPTAISDEVQRRLSSALVVRSSANCEDLENFAGAGLYESVINVAPRDVDNAVRDVWASLWTRRAAESRRQSDIPHQSAHMAVLIQELVNADFSFVLHTVNPISGDEREIYAELVVGLGETLASAASAGTPFRLICNKSSKAVSISAFGNFSRAIRAAAPGELRHEIVNYSTVGLSRDPTTLEKLGQKLSRIGQDVERAFGKPQDIEGAIVQGEIYLVQSRPQQFVPTSKKK